MATDTPPPSTKLWLHSATRCIEAASIEARHAASSASASVSNARSPTSYNDATICTPSNESCVPLIAPPAVGSGGGRTFAVGTLDELPHVNDGRNVRIRRVLQTRLDR